MAPPNRPSAKRRPALVDAIAPRGAPPQPSSRVLIGHGLPEGASTRSLKARRQPRGLAITLAVNLLIKPFTGALGCCFFDRLRRPTPETHSKKSRLSCLAAAPLQRRCLVSQLTGNEN